tara:strand:- start:673 stop:891 length:219 start_codon:yes stop_codon:yes gene_type:complete
MSNTNTLQLLKGISDTFNNNLDELANRIYNIQLITTSMQTNINFITEKLANFESISGDIEDLSGIIQNLNNN